ncbi:hypothetical protein SAMN04515665_11296 [Blastococcus sp. DSM 46786]|uniref:hypothetical protein n=1 Tax=Blastococcus sp. DSM 46786 TaxID=1798227 RepID=UPI0008C3B819|nr:hypothetical protein [Blastococcus sp. DSM 46786]SEL42374.1 hypothetical protein SAMN04515665_11296 [Blastococcus sp. DSM 46786]
MATITVYREYGAPLVGRMQVFVDGNRVAALRSEGSVDITIDGGQHTVRVALWPQASAPVELDLPADGRVTLRARVGLRANTFAALFRQRGKALDLDVVAGRPRIPAARTAHVDIRHV